MSESVCVCVYVYMCVCPFSCTSNYKGVHAANMVITGKGHCFTLRTSFILVPGLLYIHLHIHLYTFTYTYTFIYIYILI